MAMIRYNAHTEKDVVKFCTCMFEGDLMDLTSMLTYLIDQVYTEQLKKYGLKGGEIFKGMMENVLSFMWEDAKKEYLNQGGQTDDT